MSEEAGWRGAAVFGPGGRPAGDAIVAERVTKGAVEQVYWRYEDQLNSCVGQADENGWRTMQNGYLAFGEAMQSRVLYDGAVSRLSAVAYDGLALVTITLANNDLSTDLLNGALLFLARPGYNGNRHMETVVVDSTANSIVVEDLTGDLFEALGPEGQPIASFVIFAFNDSKQANAPTYQTQGTWTSAPSFASSQTTFTDIDADDNGGGFASWMVGSILVPDVNVGAPLIITGATATTLTVAGDARGVASSGSQYIVYAAPFTDPVRGTWQTDVHKGGTRYLWAGYRYQPPQMGFWVDPPGAPALGVYGAATGTNRLGQYYCWNRNYDVNLGRWTTPDSVANPYFNLLDYAGGRPIGTTDPKGNCVWVPILIGIGVGVALLASGCSAKSTTASGTNVYRGSSRGVQGTLEWSVDYSANDKTFAQFRFVPDSSATCRCEQIGFIQVISQRKDHQPHYASGDSYMGGDPSYRTAANWSVDEQKYSPSAKHVKNDVYYNAYPTSRVDPFNHPWVAEAEHGNLGSCGGVPAEMFDRPDFWRQRATFERYQGFETCAICIESHEILGCVHWGRQNYYDPRSGATIRGVQVPRVALEASSNFKGAVRLAARMGAIAPQSPPGNKMGGSSAV